MLQIIFLCSMKNRKFLPELFHFVNFFSQLTRVGNDCVSSECEYFSELMEAVIDGDEYFRPS